MAEEAVTRAGPGRRRGRGGVFKEIIMYEEGIGARRDSMDCCDGRKGEEGRKGEWQEACERQHLRSIDMVAISLCFYSFDGCWVFCIHMYVYYVHIDMDRQSRAFFLCTSLLISIFLQDIYLLLFHFWHSIFLLRGDAHERVNILFLFGCQCHPP